jgi:hypothetical protein
MLDARSAFTTWLGSCSVALLCCGSVGSISYGAVLPGAGASSDHWSLQPVNTITPPRPEDPWIRGPIDTFILDRLRMEDFDSSPDADPRTLIRRVYLDMLGLPPTPEEIQTFLTDGESTDLDAAYERLVDRVLANPHHGERWAQHWLDVVRFAESSGFEINQWSKTAWPYRDYVIRALNEDRPYDRFIFEQIAGDQCAEDAATGFLVAGPYDRVVNQALKFKKLQRQDEFDEIIKATGTAFLGVTIECARCHDHKFDPFTQRDYYALQAVFAGVRYKERRLRGPKNDRWQAKLPEIESRITPLKAKLETFRQQAGLRPSIDLEETEERFDAVETSSIRLVVEATSSGDGAHLDEFEVWSATAPARNVALSENGARVTSSGHSQGGGAKLPQYVIDGKRQIDNFWKAEKLGSAWLRIDLPQVVAVNRIVWATRVLAWGAPVDYRVEVLKNDRWVVVAHSHDRMPHIVDQRKTEDFQLDGLTPDQIQQLVGTLQEVGRLQTEYDRLEDGPQAFLGKFDEPEPTHILNRGDPMQPLDPVGPNAPAILGVLQFEGFAETSAVPETTRRASLARWLGDPSNPLTARVMVNRIWQYHFGTGLVETPSDFGTMGSPPTHPALLDWLANDFMRSGWSIKHVHRRILRSSTYRQASTPREDALLVDGGTRWLWRFPPRRLAAEVLRDSILYTSGALDPSMYGPGFAFFERHKGHENNTFADALPREQLEQASWRRMIYGTKIRQENVAVFGDFDCPNAGQTAPRRSRSTTPIQALGMLNSPFVNQQAELFSKRVQGGANVYVWVRRAFSIALGRQPTPEELRKLTALAGAYGLEQVCRVLWNTNEFLFLP